MALVTSKILWNTKDPVFVVLGLFYIRSSIAVFPLSKRLYLHKRMTNKKNNTIRISDADSLKSKVLKYTQLPKFLLCRSVVIQRGGLAKQSRKMLLRMRNRNCFFSTEGRMKYI